MTSAEDLVDETIADLRVAAAKQRAEKEGANKPKRATLDVETIANIREEKVRWWLDNRIARGKLSIVEGNPSMGKSTIMYDLIARTSMGVALPGNGNEPRDPEVSLILSPEDDPADTIKPRLRLAGADMSKIHLVRTVRDEKSRMVSLPLDIDPLEEVIDKHNVKIIIIDSLFSAIASKDSHKDSDTRSALLPVANLASRTGVSIVGIRHFPKASSANANGALLRGMGSVAWTAVVRSVLAIGIPPGTDKDLRAIAVAKGNLTGKVSSLGCRLEPVDGEQHCIVRWDERELEGVTADDLDQRSAPNRGPGSDGLARAIVWLADQLHEGPVDRADLTDRAAAAGHAWRTVQRAAKELDVKSLRNSGRPGNRWALLETDLVIDADYRTIDS